MAYEPYKSASAREDEDTVRKLKQKAEEAAETVSTEGAKALKSAGQSVDEAVAATRRFVQEQPLLALGAVAAFACVVGTLWKLAPARRSNTSEDLLQRLSEYVEPGYRALKRRV
jgi:ElaB/YqjD/DUF883 family membrane-anchored ribosome-binding protein